MSRWQDDIRRRLSGANLDPGREAEIAQELEQHLDDRYDELRALGHSDDDARRTALDELRDDRRMREELAALQRDLAGLARELQRLRSSG